MELQGRLQIEPTQRELVVPRLRNAPNPQDVPFDVQIRRLQELQLEL